MGSWPCATVLAKIIRVRAASRTMADDGAGPALRIGGQGEQDGRLGVRTIREKGGQKHDPTANDIWRPRVDCNRDLYRTGNKYGGRTRSTQTNSRNQISIDGAFWL